ncbi:hypothetical protein [Streptomyces scabiei]|uniref:hypothetical protein n=1 Tax=Streptomyces scabiei TaxID=1930 RepID=UPI0004E748D4|nr:hypothetical protein [Streptomyces scabiei]KFG05939.1 hypothetical protein IQ61_27555 [Streptomyces scabiei]MDX2837099.1 hypothetical protein [Streptomyces scabiei]MDX3681688.1 hypothetical protein [Streptomyces scabiei]
MHLLSGALVRVRAVFLGTPASDRAAQEADTGPISVEELSVPHPSPEMWAAFLASSRRRRTRCSWAREADLPGITAEEISSTLVGVYLLTPEVRQQRRQAQQFVGMA